MRFYNINNCLLSFSFIDHILAYNMVKICHNWVYVVNFLVTFLFLTTTTSLFSYADVVKVRAIVQPLTLCLSEGLMLKREP